MEGPFIPSHSFFNHLKLSKARMKRLSNSAKEHFFWARKNQLILRHHRECWFKKLIYWRYSPYCWGLFVLRALINNLFIWVFRFLTLHYPCSGDSGYLKTAYKLQFVRHRAVASIEDTKVMSLLFFSVDFWGMKEKGVWQYQRCKTILLLVGFVLSNLLNSSGLCNTYNTLGMETKASLQYPP